MTPGEADNPPTLFAYPAQAAFGRPLPKTKLYAFAKPTRRVRDLITAQVAQVTWQFKLAPDTINLPASANPSAVAEVQVFRIVFKPGVMEPPAEKQPTLPADCERILRCIDKAIPSPILFELVAGDHVRMAAAYKRASEADPAKWVIDDYHAGAWLPLDATRRPLPLALDMGGFYEQLLRVLLPLPARPQESLRDQAERIRNFRLKQRECDRLRARLNREKQFNRKVELNARLRDLENEVRRLTD